MNSKTSGTKIFMIIITGLLCLWSSDTSAIMLGGFEVLYNGSYYDSEINATTFEYTVLGLRHNSALKFFTLELPYCDEPPVILSTYPIKLVRLGVDPKTGIYGIRWERNLSAIKRRDYSVTLAGEYGEGPVQVALSNSFIDVGEITGPSCEVVPPEYYTLSGVVFFDVNLNGYLDLEPTLKDVTVYIFDVDNNLIGSYFTNYDGVYEFVDLPAGIYTVEIPSVTPDVDFNEFMYSVMFPTTSTYITINLTEDTFDYNFGFGYGAY